MAHSLVDIAEALGAEAEGATGMRVHRPAHPADAGPHDLAVAFDPKLLAHLSASHARVAIVPAGTDWRALGLAGAVLVGRGRAALAGLTAMFARQPAVAPGISAMAAIDPSAEIGAGVAIGPFCAVGPGAVVGDGTVLAASVTVGARARVGAGCLLHPGARVGDDVTIGDRAIVHQNAVIGADGFSFVTPTPGAVESAESTGAVAEAMRNTSLLRIHSLGAVTVGDDVEIGAGTTIDRGTLRDTRVGRGTKIDNNVQVGHNVEIGETCLICAQVGIAGSATIGNRVVLGGQVGVADHVRVLDDSVIGARSAVAANVPPGSVLLGSPAIPRDEALRLSLALRRLPKLIETVRDLRKRLSAAGASD
jgi:UDP-3-O-[3-hydroxymyristoyl] glucosamine N-acyltransferase